MRLAGESASQCYIRDQLVGSGQQTLCAFNPSLHKIAMRRQPRSLAKGPSEMPSAEIDRRGEFVKRRAGFNTSFDLFARDAEKTRGKPAPSDRRRASVRVVTEEIKRYRIRYRVDEK